MNRHWFGERLNAHGLRLFSVAHRTKLPYEFVSYLCSKEAELITGATDSMAGGKMLI